MTTDRNNHSENAGENTGLALEHVVTKVLSLIFALTLMAGFVCLMLTKSWFVQLVVVMNMSVISLIGYLVAMEIIKTLKNRL